MKPSTSTSEKREGELCLFFLVEPLIRREVILCDSSPVMRTTAIPLEPKGVEHATTVPIFLRRGNYPAQASLFIIFCCAICITLKHK